VRGILLVRTGVLKAKIHHRQIDATILSIVNRTRHHMYVIALANIHEHVFCSHPVNTAFNDDTVTKQ